MKKFSSREFNQHVGEAKKAAASGPVFITDRGSETHVLLSADEYRKITRKDKGRTLYQAFHGYDLAGVDPDFEFEKIEFDLRPAELD